MDNSFDLKWNAFSFLIFLWVWPPSIHTQRQSLVTHFKLAGFSGGEEPRLQFPSLLAKLKDTTATATGDEGSEGGGDAVMATYTKKGAHWVGEEALDKRGMPTITFNWPIKKGAITEWDDAEKLWGYVFKRLKVDLAYRPVLMAEPPLTPKENRELLAQVLFESCTILLLLLLFLLLLFSFSLYSQCT